MAELKSNSGQKVQNLTEILSNQLKGQLVKSLFDNRSYEILEDEQSGVDRLKTIFDFLGEEKDSAK